MGFRGPRSDTPSVRAILETAKPRPAIRPRSDPNSRGAWRAVGEGGCSMGGKGCSVLSRLRTNMERRFRPVKEIPNDGEVAFVIR